MLTTTSSADERKGRVCLISSRSVLVSRGIWPDRPEKNGVVRVDVALIWNY
jgi:hypothetical protein